ncbi:glycosyl hydrolase [Penicillium nucicola]|uniref:glycosyl hydrolase n=1 Tax=Penicillium nucicola TaxID=1850975 RepID=UPI0025457AE1|nr:glycosyl hydrolase [Penicillium nucicola]KAJ5753427.1 glycosyl hydrolase [Penicillium nucicola]
MPDIEALTPVKRDTFHYRNKLPLLSLEEKVDLLSGISFTSTAGVARLDIPALKVSDSINGVRGSKSHLEDTGTACFPSSTCLASTWNTALLREFGEEVALQAKSKSVQVVLGPNINLHRDPRGGRNFEAFSEDPLVTGQLAAAIVNGIQSQGVGACIKHFVANESETVRRRYNVDESGDSRTMREIYMRAFQHLLRRSNPVSIMTAYNALDGNFCSQSPFLKSLLRDSWNYDGCLMSDWYGTKSTVASIEAGLDLEMPGPSVFRGAKLIQALSSNEVSDAALDAAVTNVLAMIDRTAGSHSDREESIRLTEQTRSIALRTAAEGIVLLKNEDNTLPVSITEDLKIALIGAAAIKPSITGGGSACAKSQYVNTPLHCLQNACRDPKQVTFAYGTNTNHAAPLMPIDITRSRNGAPGVDVDYFLDGSNVPVYAEHIGRPVVVMLGNLKPGLTQTGFNYVMETTITVNTSGTHNLAVQATGEFTLSIDGTEILSKPAPVMTVEDFLFEPKKLESKVEVRMEAQRPYKITLKTHSRDIASGYEEISPHSVKLCFEEEHNDRAAIAEAVHTAAHSDISVIIGGRTSEHESEGFDLKMLKLADNQVRLIKAVASVSKKTILVLHGGNPIDVSDFVDDIDVVMAAHFPGQEGAQAIVDIITGKTNPSGKLATTWPMHLDAKSVPSFAHFPARDIGDGPVIRYAEGLQVGYRSPHSAPSVRWPFGFGLSYSTFKYRGLEVISQAGSNDIGSLKSSSNMITIAVDVQNVSSRAGYEVIQIYSEPPTDSVIWKPHSELIAFTKEWFESNETKRVEVLVSQRDISGYWDSVAGCWRSLNGIYKVTVGDCVSCMPIQDVTTWNGL